MPSAKRRNSARSAEGFGKSCRTGERIRPDATQAIGSYVKVRCPLCFGWSWYHNMVDQEWFPADAPGFLRDWVCEALETRLVTKWPRHPNTGRRGFCYTESHTDDEDAVERLYDEFADRARTWLANFGP